MLTSALSSSLGTLSVVSLSVHREKNTGPSFLPHERFRGSGSVKTASALLFSQEEWVTKLIITAPLCKGKLMCLGDARVNGGALTGPKEKGCRVGGRLTLHQAGWGDCHWGANSFRLAMPSAHTCLHAKPDPHQLSQHPHGSTLLVQVHQVSTRSLPASPRPGTDPSCTSHPSGAYVLDLQVASSAQLLWVDRFWRGRHDP